MTIELDFMCDVCGVPVGDGKGAIQVRYDDIHAYKAELAAWHHRHGRGPYTPAQILAAPDTAPWRIYHDHCNPQPDRNAFDIDVEKVRTWRALTEWTSRLMAKSWLGDTDWDHLINGAASGNGHRVVANGDAA